MAADVRELSTRQLEIVSTTRALLARDGVEALSLGAVAKALGIKPPSLYKHFASRGDLEAALIAIGLAELYRLITAAPLPREKLPEGLEARILMPVHKVISDPHLARAALAFAHGMVSLEIAQRFPPWSKLEKSWARALDAFAAARPPG
jgi:AcrR family transcriptional regulator